MSPWGFVPICRKNPRKSTFTAGSIQPLSFYCPTRIAGQPLNYLQINGLLGYA